MANWMPDGAGSRAKIGVLTPHMDPVPETEFQTLSPEGVSVHSARVPLGMVGPDGEIIPHIDAEIAKAFVAPPIIDEAAALLASINPKAIALGFTSSSYILGAKEDAKLKERLENRTKGIPIVIQSSALVTALKRLDAAQVSLVHPPWFSDDLDLFGVAYFENQGIKVLKHGQAKLLDEYGDIPHEQIVEWVTTHTPMAADAVVIGGGGFRATGTINEIERILQRPVLTANQAALWLALRTAGINDPIEGYGAIMKLPLG